MNQVLNLTTKLATLCDFWNADLAFIQTDGKSARIKVMAQHITTPEIIIHEGMDYEAMRVEIGFAIKKTQGVTNSRS